MRPILIAEHDKIVATTLTNLIKEKLGATCIVTKSAKETLLKLQEYKAKFELIILDLELPDAPKGGLVDPILTLNIPTILFTKNTEDEDIYRQKDIAEYIVKTSPFSIYHALNVVEQITRNKNINILVVEPDEKEASTLTMMLKTHRLNVINVSSSIEANKVISENPNIHIVVTEFDLPDENGVKLIRKLRETYNRNQMAIMVVTKNNEKYIPPKCFKSGANDFILKGYDREEFYARLNVHLEMIRLFDTIKTNTLQKANKEKMLLEDRKMDMMGELLHNISHHWRQPLMSISTTAGSLRVTKEFGGEVELDKELSSLDNIINHTQDLSNTIEMFKGFFTFKTDNEEFLVTKTLQEYANLIKIPLEDENITLIIKGDKSLTYKANRENFIQIFINIINNSKEAIIRNQPKFKYILLDINKNKNSLEINVKDSSGGIDEKINDKIYEPYFSTKEDRNGTGLGLFITRKYVVNDFRGTIGNENVEFDIDGNKCFGANFSINLPE